MLQASKFSHPNLLHLPPGGHCQFADMDLVFAFLEYAEEDVAHGLPDRPLTEEETRKVLGSRLDALSYVHGKGFAHSHIKPSHIRVPENQFRLSRDTVIHLGEPRPAYRPVDAYDAPEVATAPVTLPVTFGRWV
ncbi:MAG: hypothetical protein DMG39_05995 [Acidobacteria bacterium]|nr:MAG: hypothetical protein DMG39_05995 [Acidobacteriota bacterium]